MKIILDSGRLEEIRTDFLALPFCEEWKKRKQPYKEIEDVLKSKEFTGEMGKVSLLHNINGKKRLLLIGLGKEREIDLEKIRKAFAVVISIVKELKLSKFSVLFQKLGKLDDKDIVRSICEGILLGNYDFDKYKLEEKKKTKEIEEFELYCPQKNLKEIKTIVNETKIICDNVNLVRNFVNEGSDVMNPNEIEKIVKDFAKKYRMKLKILGKKELQSLGMNLILSVGRASKYKPRLLILEYGKGKKKVALIGKGVTFDTGGLNLKPTGYIETMKLDKAGALTVLGILKTLAELKAKTNVVGVIPLCENMIGSEAYKPGSVVKSYSGKTVEIVNTDAEGRLIMADALAYAEKNLKPDVIIDLATLTGSVLVTFGEYVAGMVSNDDKLAKKMFESGEKTYERVWRLPLYEEYKEEMKGEISDVKNIGYKDGKYAGTITASAFLNNFIKSKYWIHLDIAGTAWWEKRRYYVPKGGTGFGIRLLIEFLRSI
jgi:leucyl aminopeptidase